MPPHDKGQFTLDNWLKQGRRIDRGIFGMEVRIQQLSVYRFMHPKHLLIGAAGETNLFPNHPRPACHLFGDNRPLYVIPILGRHVRVCQ